MKKVLQAVVEAGQFEVARALVLASSREFHDKGHVDENERQRGGRASAVDGQEVRVVGTTVYPSPYGSLDKDGVDRLASYSEVGVYVCVIGRRADTLALCGCFAQDSW